MALAEIDKRESEVREQFKSGELPALVFKSWLSEFATEREALNRPPYQRRRRAFRASSSSEHIAQLPNVSSRSSLAARTSR
jgi:hypothetical protein